MGRPLGWVRANDMARGLMMHQWDYPSDALCFGFVPMGLRMVWLMETTYRTIWHPWDDHGTLIGRLMGCHVNRCHGTYMGSPVGRPMERVQPHGLTHGSFPWDRKRSIEHCPWMEIHPIALSVGHPMGSFFFHGPFACDV